MYCSVAIEQGTTNIWYGRFIDFPGTIARALSRQLLLKELEEELNYHVKWLRNHGEITALENFKLIVREEVKDVVDLGESGGEVALFEFDKQSVTQEKMKFSFLLMDYNRKDLLNLVLSISQEQMEHTPPGKNRNILEILTHLCNAETFYLSRLGTKSDRRYEENAGMSEDEIDELPIFERLDVVRKACKKTFEELIPDKKDTLFTRRKYSKHHGEIWTAHKVMRRFLEHEREHYYNIQEYLGIPIRT